MFRAPCVTSYSPTDPQYSTTAATSRDISASTRKSTRRAVCQPSCATPFDDTPGYSPSRSWALPFEPRHIQLQEAVKAGHIGVYCASHSHPRSHNCEPCASVQFLSATLVQITFARVLRRLLTHTRDPRTGP